MMSKPRKTLTPEQQEAYLEYQNKYYQENKEKLLAEAKQKRAAEPVKVSRKPRGGLPGIPRLTEEDLAVLRELKQKDLETPAYTRVDLGRMNPTQLVKAGNKILSGKARQAW